MTSEKLKSTSHSGTVITTHVNADYDGIASLLAAQKLYPGSIVAFPGSSETTVRNFFIESMVYLFNMVEIDDIDFSTIERLVLVDTRKRDRIGKLAALIDKPGIDIHAYDHHPTVKNDIKPHQEFHEATGATVSILVHLIKEKNIPLSADEATIMCLGIYEDTGSFTFSSTTEKDFTAAAFLLSKGANLNIISDMIAREISAEQLSVLNDMIQSSTRYKINGIEVLVTTISSESYIPDFAFLVHKMLKMESLNAIFAVARMGGKIYIVARSRVTEVDVGEILRNLGGGGHAFAAAATVRDMTLAQVDNLLFETLYRTIRPAHSAIDLMSSPAITVMPEISCKEGGKLLTQYNVNALLVATHRQGKDFLHGYISRQVIEKALYHKLGEVAVKEYMSTELLSVDPSADLQEIQEKIIENKQRILPVIEKDAIIGVITRTDLLNMLVNNSQETNGHIPDPFRQPLTARTRNVKRLMKERLSAHLLQILTSIGKIAKEIGCSAYVVGGFVRDLFLYRTNEDIDIVIEGDGIAFARAYAKNTDVRIHTYEKFGTAVIIYSDGFKIDVASARMEYYQFPAALPTVEMSSIKLDLFRRDFTINTLAIHLAPDKFGLLIDFFQAQRDIKEKSIRILHNLSFVEDPTRVFRAIRFEQRFGFSIGKLTAGLIRNAVKMDFFKRLSGRRVFTELKLILEEENPTPAIVRLADYNLLQFVDPSILIDKKLIGILNSVKKVLAWHDLLFLEESYNRWAVYFLALIRGCDPETSRNICKHLELKPGYHLFFSRDRQEAEHCLKWLEHKLPIKNSLLYKRLSVFKPELILYMMAATKQRKVERSISYYFTHLKNIHISLKGKDILSLGVKPGPIFKQTLDAVMAAKLNGQIKTRDDELVFAQKYLAKTTQNRSGEPVTRPKKTKVVTIPGGRTHKNH